jgi:hypothetical protein
VWVNYEVQRQALDFDLGVMELDDAGVRREHEAPLTAYIAGAEAIRSQLCSASDIIPTLAEPAKKPQPETIQPLPLDFPDSLLPGEDGPPADRGAPLPAPMQNPAAAYRAPNPEAAERLSHDTISASDARITLALAQMPGFDDEKPAKPPGGAGQPATRTAGTPVRDDSVTPASYNLILRAKRPDFYDEFSGGNATIGETGCRPAARICAVGRSGSNRPRGRRRVVVLVEGECTPLGLQDRPPRRGAGRLHADRHRAGRSRVGGRDGGDLRGEGEEHARPEHLADRSRGKRRQEG